MMDYTTLGRTGLKVSRMGLGCGGHSRLGLATGGSDAEAERVVRAAVTLGVNFIDTAEIYGTEEVVGRALADTTREQIILSTKAGVEWEERRSTGAELKTRLDACLKRLRMDYVDIFHLHGVTLSEYDYACQELLPVLLDLKTAGKVRFLGITETFKADMGHGMLSKAVQDAVWDVIMVGFNLLNQSARERVLTITQQNGIGTLCMFAVRRALSQPEALQELLGELMAQELLDEDQLDQNASDPLGFLVAEGVASSLPEAAYRFCRWEPGMDVVLSGTGKIDHLNANAATLSLPPLPAPIIARLQRLFARVDTVSGN